MPLDSRSSELDFDEQALVIESFGRTVQVGQGSKFEELIRSFNLSSIINVTGWTHEAVRVLLTVGEDKNVKLTLRNGQRYYTVVTYPTGSAVHSCRVNRGWTVVVRVKQHLFTPDIYGNLFIPDSCHGFQGVTVWTFHSRLLTMLTMQGREF